MHKPTFDLSEVFARNKALFGDLRMEADTAPPAAPAGDPPAPEPDKTYTQADLDRLVGQARIQARPKDYDEMKAAAKRLADIEAASATEQEKAVKAARDETEKTVRAEVQRERVLDRVEVLAAKDFADPDDARLRLEKRADEFVTKDGSVDAEAIKTALAALLKDKPHLSAKGDGRPKGDASQGPKPDSKPDPGPGVNRMRAAYASTSKTP